jgi:alcohol dehydrogenase
MRFEHYSPTRIVFGRGKFGDLPNFLPTDAGRILVVTRKRSSKENGSLEILQDSLKRTGKVCFVFDKVEQNPSTKTVNTGARFVREKSPDLVVGLGGGSAMDTAKCIALLAKNDGDIEDYIRGKKASNLPLPIVAIPTTAGTGSEVTQYAVVTDSKLNTKGAYAGPEIFPMLALLDPELTLSMPKEVTVNTGVDALTHAIEGYLSNRATPISDILALESVKIIKETLRRSKSSKGTVRRYTRGSWLRTACT